MTWHAAELHFAGDHPTAAGHFPMNPIIPGALLLDAVVAAITANARDHMVMIRTAKFLNIVRPGESLNLRWQSLASGGVKFECRLFGKDDLAASGTLELGPAA